jgi:hypothetical protein
MNHKKLLSQVFFLTFLLFSLDGCFLFPDSSSKETLPPPTQTGANTFGCYVNGKLWLPKGYNGTSNLNPYYDPNFHGKIIFDISAYRLLSDKDQQYLGIAITGMDKEGVYPVDTHRGNVNFSINSCDYLYNDTTVFKQGSIIITKLNLPVVSGTFEFKLYKSGCDTITFTQGRFDIKL